jgi:hypothetical protein
MIMMIVLLLGTGFTTKKLRVKFLHSMEYYYFKLRYQLSSLGLFQETRFLSKFNSVEEGASHVRWLEAGGFIRTETAFELFFKG